MLRAKPSPLQHWETLLLLLPSAEGGGQSDRANMEKKKSSFVLDINMPLEAEKAAGCLD